MTIMGVIILMLIPPAFVLYALAGGYAPARLIRLMLAVALIVDAVIFNYMAFPSIPSHSLILRCDESSFGKTQRPDIIYVTGERALRLWRSRLPRDYQVITYEEKSEVVNLTTQDLSSTTVSVSVRVRYGGTVKSTTNFLRAGGKEAVEKSIRKTILDFFCGEKMKVGDQKQKQKLLANIRRQLEKEGFGCQVVSLSVSAE